MAHTKTRGQFDQPFAEFQGITWKFADMAIRLDATGLMIYQTTANAVDEALQIHGAIGYSKTSPIEYLYR